MTTMTFQQLLGGSLLTVRAELRDLRLDVPEGLVKSVVDVTSGTPERLPGPWPEGKLSAAEHMAYDAAGEICTMAAGFSPDFQARALALAAEAWSAVQNDRHEEDHPTGRSDAATHREEAPWGA